MPDSEERIRDMVRAAMQEDPRVKNRVLMERARRIDAGAVEDLTLRQFHGKFRLPVSRSLADSSPAKAKAKARTKRAPRSPRTPDAPVVADASKQDAVRDIFRRFAVQLSQAEGRSEIVRAAARIDEFVKEVFRTVGDSDAPRPDPEPPRRTRRRRTRAEGPQEGSTRAEPGGDATTADRPTASGGAEEATPPARDMRRRRRPKAMLKPRPEETAPTAESPPEQASVAESVPDSAASRTEPASSLGLLHDLEEFRRRRAEREMRGRLAP